MYASAATLPVPKGDAACLTNGDRHAISVHTYAVDSIFLSVIQLAR